MEQTMQWQGHPPSDSQGTGSLSGHHEDWEDWLRWDPLSDVTAVGNTSSGSGSGKYDSPVQDAAMPVSPRPDGQSGADMTLPPPVIASEDPFDFKFGDGGGLPFPFDTGENLSDVLDFNTRADQTSSLNALEPSKLNNFKTDWGYVPAGDQSQDTTWSSFSQEHYDTVPDLTPSSGTVPSQQPSPESANNNVTSNSSGSPEAPPPKKRGGRKRKVPVEEELKSGEGSGSNGDEPPVKKTSHNVIEKRYRNNLNDKIVELRNSVPSLRAMSRTTGNDDSENLEGLTPAHKLNKATVMAKATEYIKHLEKRNKTMAEEMDELKTRLSAVEKAIKSSQSRAASISQSPPTSFSYRSPQTSSASQASTNGVWQSLRVPQANTGVYSNNMSQEQYTQQQMQPTYTRALNPPVEAQNQEHLNAGRGGGMMGKVMVGAMGGLMMMEGFYDQQQQPSSGHGLFAAPFHILKRGSMTSDSPLSALSQQSMLPLLKTFFILGAILSLIAPLLSWRPTRKQKQSRASIRLTPAPSLASPVEVRRKAWLTAVQTVWVPKHFLLEVVAVTLKMIKLSLRRLIGTQNFTTLTGVTPEDEAARIKAWDIAIDAQLAGGDSQVSYYSLLLTLMASGTLPDSPTRLMQKAVHFRLFFWEVANAGYGDLIMFKRFTEKIGKIYWDSARVLQRQLVESRDIPSRIRDKEREGELLPEHLARLIELDCDDVLTDDIIQRAWNLAWNKPSAYRTQTSEALDSVVEDHAIRSPLDAVAAWFANTNVDAALAESLGSKNSPTDGIEELINLASATAPPASATQVRALAAKAVLVEKDRTASIKAVLDALPSRSPTSGMNLTTQTPISHDINTALTLAKLLSLAAIPAPFPARQHAMHGLESVKMPPPSFTLLTATAAICLLRTLSHDKDVLAASARGLEDLAGSLRVWVGTSAGRDAGLTREERGLVVDECLGVARKVGGWGEREKDSGYGSPGEEGREKEADVGLVVEA